MPRGNADPGVVVSFGGEDCCCCCCLLVVVVVVVGFVEVDVPLVARDWDGGMVVGFWLMDGIGDWFMAGFYGWVCVRHQQVY